MLGIAEPAGTQVAGSERIGVTGITDRLLVECSTDVNRRRDTAAWSILRTWSRGTRNRREKTTADYVFYELTRSICPECRRTVDAHVILRGNKVYMRKRCPTHGQFESLVYGDAEAYVRNARFNKPGAIPLEFATEVVHGCPHDCGLCPDHQQHACVGIIEVNSGCNMACPLCFANAAPGFSLMLEEVDSILDRFVASEGRPDVVQFSGGEPTIHPDIIPMVEAAKARGIPLVMINTNGRRIAHDDEFVRQLARVRPAIYFQFDGFEDETYRIIRGESGLLPEELRALRTRQDQVRFVQVRHEESAALMACAYAKFTGKLGVCLATSGPGGIHLLNACTTRIWTANRYLRSPPLSRPDRHVRATGRKPRSPLRRRRCIQHACRVVP